jgi:hypothetical protein
LNDISSSSVGVVVTGEDGAEESSDGAGEEGISERTRASTELDKFKYLSASSVFRKAENCNSSSERLG